MDRDVSQISEDDIKLLVLLLVFIKIFESIINNDLVIFSVIFIQDIATCRSA